MAVAQSADTALAHPADGKYLAAVSQKFDVLNKRLGRSVTRAIARSQKQEQKIYRKLLKKDTLAARKFLEQSNEQYAALQQSFTAAKEGQVNKPLKEYNKYFDTIKTTLNFLQQSTNITNNPALQKALGNSKQYEVLMQTSNEVKRLLAKRSSQLSNELARYGVGKQLNKLKGEAYTLKAQLNEYKSLLKDRKKAEQKLMTALRSSKRFNEFIKKNSILARMFNVPNEPANSATGSLAGLQTISSVQAQINQRYGNTGINPQQYMNQQVNAAQNQMNQLKARLNKAKAGSNSDPEMPKNYSSLRSKNFLQRMTFETNFHTQRLQVTMTDISLTVGYKLNDRSIFSIGGSARIGLGKDWNNIRLTGEGYGLRSVLDWKLKHSLWMTGSYETNYYNRFNTPAYSSYTDPWQANILLGLMKKIRLNSKKSSTVRLAYNILYKQNNFLTQPVVFRVGYGF